MFNLILTTIKILGGVLATGFNLLLLIRYILGNSVIVAFAGFSLVIYMIIYAIDSGQKDDNIPDAPNIEEVSAFSLSPKIIEFSAKDLNKASSEEKLRKLKVTKAPESSSESSEVIGTDSSENDKNPPTNKKPFFRTKRVQAFTIEHSPGISESELRERRSKNIRRSQVG